MRPELLSRRHFLGTLGAAALWVRALELGTLPPPPNDTGEDGDTSREGAETWRGETLVTLTAAQAADLDAFAEQIVPSERDGLGARDAGSVFFIDRALASFAKTQRPLFTKGLAELQAAAAKRGARSFAALPAARQTEVLKAMETAKSEFFAAARAAVITGMFADPKYGGNRNKIGWRLLGFEDRFHWMAPFGWYDREANRAT